MYCNHCECDSCRLKRDAAKAKADQLASEALRLIARAGDTGRTVSELSKYSRQLRAIGKQPLSEVVGSLETAGLVIKHRFNTAGRGKWRDAFLATKL